MEMNVENFGQQSDELRRERSAKLEEPFCSCYQSAILYFESGLSEAKTSKQCF